MTCPNGESSCGENPKQLTIQMMLDLLVNCNAWFSTAGRFRLVGLRPMQSHGPIPQKGPGPGFNALLSLPWDFNCFWSKGSMFSFCTGPWQLCSWSWLQSSFSLIDCKVILHPRRSPYEQKEETSHSQNVANIQPVTFRCLIPTWPMEI